MISHQLKQLSFVLVVKHTPKYLGNSMNVQNVSVKLIVNGNHW